MIWILKCDTDSGNSIPKHRTHLCLLEATQHYTTMVIQVEEMKAFLTQVCGSSGKGPRSSTHDRTDKNTQNHAAEAYSAEFGDKSFRGEAGEGNNNPQVFILGGSVRYISVPQC